MPRLRRVSSDDVYAHEKQLKQNSLSNNTACARHRTRQATAHTQQQEQQQEQQDEHKELEKQDVQEEQGRTGRADHSTGIPLQRGVRCGCSHCCSCSAVSSVTSLTRQPCLRSTTHDRVAELSETRQCAEKTCHTHRRWQCSSHQQQTIGCVGITMNAAAQRSATSATIMSGSGVDAAAAARYTAPPHRRDDGTTRSHRRQRRVHRTRVHQRRTVSAATAA